MCILSCVCVQTEIMSTADRLIIPLKVCFWATVSVIRLPCKQLSVIRVCHVSTAMLSDLSGWVNAHQKGEGGREGGKGSDWTSYLSSVQEAVVPRAFALY